MNTYISVHDFSADVFSLWVADGWSEPSKLMDGEVDLSPSSCVVSNGTLYFLADGGRQLWKSDGTSSGTRLVTDVATPDQDGSPVRRLAAVDGRVYFANSEASAGSELWVTDPAAGTRRVADINPGAASSTPHDFVSWNDRVYFAANDGSSPRTSQLWKSDGPLRWAARVQTSTPAATGDSGIGPTAMLGGQMLFVASDGVNGSQLWKTDGTTSGTSLVKTLRARDLTAFRGAVYFIGGASARDFGLWKTNGTSAGTVLIKGLPDLFSENDSVFDLVAASSRLFFGVYASDGDRYALWSSDGTTQGTSEIANDFSSLGGLTAAGDKAFFSASDGAHGSEPWASDGTAAGTVMLADVYSGSYGSYPSGFVALGGMAYFTAYTDSGTYYGFFKTDGTRAGTSQVVNLPAYPDDLTAVGQRLFLSVGFDQVWVSDGSYGGTHPVDIPGVHLEYIDSLVALGDRLIFRADDGSHGSEFWVSDGTAAGSMLLKDVNRGADSGIGWHVQTLVHGGILYFAANDGTSGDELWRTDGTPDGTWRLADIDPGAGSSYPRPLAYQNGQLWLSADDGIHGAELMSATLEIPPPMLVPPSIAPISDRSISVGDMLLLSTSAFVSDPNTPRLSLIYALGAGAPAGMTIDPASGLLRWAPPAGMPSGAYGVTLVVTGNGSPSLASQRSFTVRLIGPPLIAAIDDRSINTGDMLVLSTSAFVFDPNAPRLSLSYALGAGAPAGMIIDSFSGLLRWAPPAGMPSGAYGVTLVVTGNGSPSLTSWRTFTVHLIGPPRFSAIPDKFGPQGQTFRIDTAAFATADPNAPGQALRYSLDPGAPAGSTIDPITGVFLWTPPLGAAIGPYAITVRATALDGGSLSAATTFGLNVQYAGPPPTITRSAVSARGAFAITLTFSEPLSPSRAAWSANYQLFVPNQNRRKPGRIVMLTARYNAAKRTVTLTTRTPVNLKLAPRLTVLASPGSGLTSAFGVPLAGRVGQPGTNYVATVTKRGLARIQSAAEQAEARPPGPAGPLLLLQRTRN